MQALGCRAPGFEVHVKRICQMDMTRDPHKFFVPIQLALATKCPIFVSPDIGLKNGWRVKYLSIPEHSNWVQVDVHWDNYNHPPTRERMSVCAWCYTWFSVESQSEMDEEVLATQYLINQREVPRSCLTR